MKNIKKILTWSVSIIVAILIVIVSIIATIPKGPRYLKGSMWVLQNPSNPNICEIWGFNECDTILYCVMDITCKDCEIGYSKVPYKEDDLYVKFGKYIDCYIKKWINDDLVTININGKEIKLARAETESDEFTAKLKKRKKIK